MTPDELFNAIKDRYPSDELKAQREINAAKFILEIVNKAAKEALKELLMTAKNDE